MNAENTRAFISAAPAARSTLFGCQSIARTVERRGFLRWRETHQLFSSSNEQTAIVLPWRVHADQPTPISTRPPPGTHLAPLPTANLSSAGLHLTHVAARLMRKRTSAGFHSPPGWGVQT